MLILDFSGVQRLEPYFEPPSKAEDTNSPVGPLQHHVAEPDLVEWENIDWAALNLGPDTPYGVYTAGNRNNDSSLGIDSPPNFNLPTMGATDQYGNEPVSSPVFERMYIPLCRIQQR